MHYDVWCGAVWCGVCQCGVCCVVQCGVCQCGAVWCGVCQCGVCGVVQCGVFGVVCGVATEKLVKHHPPFPPPWVRTDINLHIKHSE